MFRIIQTASFTFGAKRPLLSLNGAKLTSNVWLFRNYSSDDKSKPPLCKSGGRPHDTKSARDKVPVDTVRVQAKDVCKVSPKSPCSAPPVSPCKPGARKTLPHYQECGQPNLMDKCPKPQCPWDDEFQKQQKKHYRHLLFGLLALATAMIGMYSLMSLTKEEKTTVETGRKFKRPKKCKKTPESSAKIPEHVPYLLVGGGTASFSAFRAIKSADPTAKVLVVAKECNYPYMRPPLSKEMWFSDDVDTANKLVFKQWNGTERSLFYEPQDFYADCASLMSSPNGGVSVVQGWEVKKIDAFERIAYLDDGKEIKYDKCLIATGAAPKNLDVFAEADTKIQNRVTLYRDIFDFQELDEICQKAKKIAIIGGGFLGSELACALARKSQKTQMKVTQIFRENGNMGKVLPEYLSQWTTQKVRYEGVNIISKAEVEDVRIEDNQLKLSLSNGNNVFADHVIVAVGVEPNTELAQTSDLETDPDLGGFLVNAELEARSHLYVAGDCCCFYDVKLGRRRVEHHDHAVVSGRLAGENMAGGTKPYWHQSMFWSDLGPDVGYEAIGVVDSSLPTVGVFAKATDKDNPKAVVTATDEGLRSETEQKAGPVKPASSTPPSKDDDYGKGIIFYLRDDIVVGIVLWNVFNRMSVARQVLADGRKYEDLNEVAKLFNIHEE